MYTIKKQTFIKNHIKNLKKIISVCIYSAEKKKKINNIIEQLLNTSDMLEKKEIFKKLNFELLKDFNTEEVQGIKKIIKKSIFEIIIYKD